MCFQSPGSPTHTPMDLWDRLQVSVMQKDGPELPRPREASFDDSSPAVTSSSGAGAAEKAVHPADSRKASCMYHHHLA